MNWTIWAVLAFAGLVVGLAVMDRLRLRQRPGMSKSQFAAAFRGESVPEAITSVAYDYYTSDALGDGVQISPDDDLDKLLVGKDDLDEDLQRLLKKLVLDMPSSATLAASPHPLRTIRDVVRWLNWVRQHQTT